MDMLSGDVTFFNSEEGYGYAKTRLGFVRLPLDRHVLVTSDYVVESAPAPALNPTDPIEIIITVQRAPDKLEALLWTARYETLSELENVRDAEVKFFIPDKGYGFLLRKGEKDLFMHADCYREVIEGARLRRMPKGSKLDFKPGQKIRYIEGLGIDRKKRCATLWFLAP